MAPSKSTYTAKLVIPATIALTPSYNGLRVGADVALRVTNIFFLEVLVSVSLAEPSVELVLIKSSVTDSLDSVNWLFNFRLALNTAAPFEVSAVFTVILFTVKISVSIERLASILSIVNTDSLLTFFSIFEITWTGAFVWKIKPLPCAITVPALT